MTEYSFYKGITYRNVKTRQSTRSNWQVVCRSKYRYLNKNTIEIDLSKFSFCV